MNPEEINYSGQYLNNTEYRIKIRTGSDIEKAKKERLRRTTSCYWHQPCFHMLRSAGEQDAVICATRPYIFLK